MVDRVAHKRFLQCGKLAMGVIAAFFLIAQFKMLNAVPVTDKPAPTAASFSLRDQTGKLLTQDDFKGKPSIIFFGFTSCPDICPTTLYDISSRLSKLGDQADKLNVIFVSVDSARDTPDVLQSYLAHFDHRIVGLTGDKNEIARLAKSVGARFEKISSDEGDYSYNHSIMHFLLDAQWRRVGVLYARGGEAGEARTVAKLKALIGE